MKPIGSLSFLSHIIQLKYCLCHESDTDLLDHLQSLKALCPSYHGTTLRRFGACKNIFVIFMYLFN